MTAGHESDLAERTRAVLDAAADYVFGTDPGRLAAELYDVLVRTTDDADRARLAAALARCWSYGGRSDRAAQFSEEAVARAEQVGDPALLADCLDAVLACHWGPDDLPLRATTAARLDEVSAHVLDPQARLQAHLWGLQVACESLRTVSMRRHLRALDRLGEESPRARFYAASRRWTYDMLLGRTDRASDLIAEAEAASEEAELPDGWMVTGSMRGYTALRLGDHDEAAEMGRKMDDFARDEGIPAVAAAAAAVWAQLGERERAQQLLGELGDGALEALPRDFDYLPILCCTLEAALALGDVEMVRTASRLLAPYENRAVVDAGAVYVYGVTDDVLARAAANLGEEAEAERLRERALATYRRIGATWSYERLADGRRPDVVPARSIHFHPGGPGVWLIGPGEGVPVRALRGFDYLHALVSRPGRPIAAIDLVTGGSGTVLQPDVGPQIDRTAAAAYRRRLRELEDQLAEVEDDARVEVLTEERDALLTELRSAAGLAGRARSSGSSAERARVSVTKAISTAIDRLDGIDPELAAHLRTSVRTGSECSYRPTSGSEVAWVLRSP